MKDRFIGIRFNRLLSNSDTPTHLCKHTWDYLFPRPFFSLHRLISSPVCVLLLRGGVVDQTPGPGVWAHVFNRAAEGMRCQKVSGCQPAIIHLSLSLPSSSLVLSPSVWWPHICQTLPWWATERVTSPLLGFLRLWSSLWGHVGFVTNVFSHPLRVTISMLCCVDADGFDLTRRGWPPK